MKIKNKDPGFYSIMGPVFGSREIQRKTGDRFFDDDQKEWYIEFDNNEEILAIVSVDGNIMKNIYGKDDTSLLKILKELYYIISSSIVTSVYEELYREAGYDVIQHSKNFVKICGGNVNGAIFI